VKVEMRGRVGLCPECAAVRDNPAPPCPACGADRPAILISEGRAVDMQRAVRLDQELTRLGDALYRPARSGPRGEAAPEPARDQKEAG